MRRQRSPRIYVCVKPTAELNVYGNHGVSMRLVYESQVDFNQVIGEDALGPMTVERALGPHTEAFKPATANEAPVPQHKHKDKD